MRSALLLGLALLLLAGAAVGGYLFWKRDGAPVLPAGKADSLDAAAARPDSAAPAAGVLPPPVAVDTAPSPLAAAAGDTRAADSTLAAPRPAPRVTIEPARLAKIYAQMKPAEAARVLVQLEDADIQTVLGQLRDRQAAAILAQLPPERAASLSQAALHAAEGPP